MAFNTDDLLDSLNKTASVLIEVEGGNSSSELQNMVGDPDDYRSSAFVQFQPNPGHNQIPNPLSPIEGDEMFFAYLIPGAKFQALDGSQWILEDYPWQGMVHISNVWYPRLNAQVSVYDIRRSIQEWVEPIQAPIPPPPAGVDYSAMRVKIIDNDVTPGPAGADSHGGGW